MRIQGAENIAIAAVDSIYDIIHHSRKLHAKELLAEVREHANKLIKTRPTEPCLFNSLNFILSEIEKYDIVDLVKSIDARIREAREHYMEAKKNIANFGAGKIADGSVVFTHCHSSTVVALLKDAHARGIKFEVHNTETRPLFQGRKTAEELSKAGIKVRHYVDSAARLALKKADICLIGADSISSDGSVINKIGTELFLEIAKNYEIPVYVCSDSWKFDSGTIGGKDTVIEQRPRDEVWPDAPKGISIMNPAFELVSPKFITAVISELGVYHPEVFIEELRRVYPWIIGHHL